MACMENRRKKFVQETDHALDKKCASCVQSRETKFKYRSVQNKTGQMLWTFLCLTELLV
jgi:hypothetical protein